MAKHPKAGQPVKIANGPLKGRYFVVQDFFVNQYQGRSIEKIAQSQGHHLVPMKRRGYPIDSDVVWGRLYPEMNWCCVHDKELLVDMQVVEGGGEKVELPPNVEAMSKKRKPKAIKGGPNDGGTAS